MARIVGIGHQNFEQMITDEIFYIDKTLFIREWWENRDIVTLITRPRRFGKTLTMSMVEQFFSVEYADKGELFKDLSIWKEEKYREIQGKYPVISLSFADIRENTYEETKKKICQLLVNLYEKWRFLMEGTLLSDREKAFFSGVSVNMEEYAASMAIKMLSGFLYRYYKKRVIILLDEYDTPMQEAYIHGYWDELARFTGNIFQSAFKTNEYLERAIMTGITRVSKESVFSELNNLEVVTTTSTKYEDSFGFTQEEVSEALAEYGLEAQEKKVKNWYDGFTFGQRSDIYNPWSVLNYLDKRVLSTYWANTSSNALIDRLIREGGQDIKMAMEGLLKGENLCTRIDEQIVFGQLRYRTSAVWSLMLACGYLRVVNYRVDEERGLAAYELALTNKEVHILFETMIHGWFADYTPAYNEFVRAMLAGDIHAMNVYMNRIALATFSYFDTGKRPSEESEPEGFYHGFVLGLLVELEERYQMLSNRESGFGRYDVMLEPLQKQEPAVILEFKVFDPHKEKDLEDTAKEALRQIEEKKYAASLSAKGISKDQILRYGFAFEGKKVRIEMA